MILSGHPILGLRLSKDEILMEPDSAPLSSTTPGTTSADVAGAGRSLPEAPENASALAMLDQLKAEFGPEYQVIRHIGDESFGRLFLAWEHGLRRHVVFKVLRREFVHNEEARLRFEREARAAAGIAHPNVVTVLWADKLSDGVPYFAELYTGECTLQQRLKAVGRFQPAEVREILIQLAAALEAAHHANIVHRDVRPENIRCEEETGRLLLSDFGIAGILESASLDETTITRSGEMVGSAGYMSPEQMHCQHVTDRSDIYNLGVLAWRLLAGARATIPVLGERTDRAALLSVAPDDVRLIDLITRCLRADPGDRPSASQIVQELQTVTAMRNGGGRSTDVRSELMDRFVPFVALAIVSTAVTAAGLLSDLFQSATRDRWIIITLIIAAFLAALVITWFHGKKGRQAITRTEIVLLTAIGVACLAAFIAIVIWIPSG